MLLLIRRIIGFSTRRFCYSPSKEKRDLMLELEAIIRSVAVINEQLVTSPGIIKQNFT
jgi:hypothetical protein